MKTLLLILIMFGATVPSIIFAQNNRISVQTGLFHYFFDKTPVLNINYLNKKIKPFNGLFYNSLGIGYQREINEKNAISIAYDLYSETYHNVFPQQLEKAYYYRTYNTINTTYNRNLKLSSQWKFTYGGGIDFRFGEEAVLIYYHPFESSISWRQVRDFGVNIRTGIEYSPLEWLTLYTQLILS